MKKLLLLTILAVSSLIAFSQKGTVIDSNQVCFPIHVAKQIAKDLVSGDSAKATLILVEAQLKETDSKLDLKDKTINLLKEKDENNQTIINAERNKYGILEDYSKKLERQLKKEKVKNKFKSIISYGVVGALTFFLIIK